MNQHYLLADRNKEWDPDSGNDADQFDITTGIQGERESEYSASLEHLVKVWPDIPPHVRESIVLLIDAIQVRSQSRIDAFSTQSTETQIVSREAIACGVPGPRHRFYAACRHCTAKWFSRQKPTCCPRCGHRNPLVELGEMHWHTVLHEEHHSEVTGGGKCCD